MTAFLVRLKLLVMDQPHGIKILSGMYHGTEAEIFQSVSILKKQLSGGFKHLLFSPLWEHDPFF